jgi:hypothetical protein
VEPGDSEFSSVNGRDVLATGDRRIWRCPTCAWWRDWTETRCCGCGAHRDAIASPQTAAAGKDSFAGLA